MFKTTQLYFNLLFLIYTPYSYIANCYIILLSFDIDICVYFYMKFLTVNIENIWLLIL